MKILQHYELPALAAVLLFSPLILGMGSSSAIAQNPDNSQQEPDISALEQQLTEIQNQVNALQEALNGKGVAPSPPQAGKRLEGMAGKGKGKMKRMEMMGRMTNTTTPEPATILASLPGFSGASHIYHIGSSGHFLDYSSMFLPSQEQRGKLTRIQEQSFLEQANFSLRIEQAERDLWALTSAGEPNAQAVEAKVFEIAELTALQRLSFIQSVGMAAGILTVEQRNTLVGKMSSSFPSDKPEMDMGMEMEASKEQEDDDMEMDMQMDSNHNHDH